MAEGKSPFWAAVLSLLIAGLGQLYLRKYSRAAVFLVLELATSALLAYDEAVGIILNLLVSLYASYDAYSLAYKTKEEKVPEEDIPVVFVK
jgi:TM2 domain-containing membrane protein YozV